MIRRPPRSTPLYSSAASDVYKRQIPYSYANAISSAYVYEVGQTKEKEIYILCQPIPYCDRCRTSNYRHYPDVSQAEVVAKSDLKCTKPDVFSTSGMRIR